MSKHLQYCCAAVLFCTTACADSDQIEETNDAGVDGARDAGLDAASLSTDQIVIGWSHVCALRSNGRVFCWGENANGQLGQAEELAESPLPLEVPGLEDVTKLTLHTALTSDGSVYNWGNWLFGPQQAALPLPAVDIADRCAVLTDGSVFCRMSFDYEFQRVEGIADAVSVSDGRDHACAVLANGTAACWGTATTFEGVPLFSQTPEVVDGLTDVIQTWGLSAASPYEHVCAQTTAATFCWGANWMTLQGNGDDATIPVPTVVTSFKERAVAQTKDCGHTCGIDDQDQLWCWGLSQEGQLAGQSPPFRAPTPILIEDAGLTRHVAVGGSRTCTVTLEGDVLCWGRNAPPQRVEF